MTRAPRYDLPKAAPAPLRAVQLVLNTETHETGRELLATPADAASWFAEHGFAVERVAPAELERAQSARRELRAFLSGDAPGPALRVAAERARLTVDLGAPALVASADGLDGALGAILALVYDAVRDGSWSRLKTCRTCGWAFWDESRSRTAAWCSMQLCGNRPQVRRYRDRRRGAAREARQ